MNWEVFHWVTKTLGKYFIYSNLHIIIGMFFSIMCNLLSINNDEVIPLQIWENIVPVFHIGLGKVLNAIECNHCMKIRQSWQFMPNIFAWLISIHLNKIENIAIWKLKILIHSHTLTSNPTINLELILIYTILDFVLCLTLFQKLA